MRTCRLIAVTALAAAVASSAAAAAASTADYSMSDIGAAPATAFKISDIGPTLTPGHIAPADSDRTPAAPEDLYKISAISPR